MREPSYSRASNRGSRLQAYWGTQLLSLAYHLILMLQISVGFFPWPQLRIPG